jgi:hypothetical protein
MTADTAIPFEGSPDDTGAFPGPGDALFPAVSASGPSSSPWSTAQAWHDYTTSYREAADLLVAHVEETGWRAEKLRFPILFLYRQHLELMVKSLIRVCCDALGRNQEFPKHHDLHRLWQICTCLLHEISPNASVDEVRETSRLFQELSGFDPAADAFRFPESKSGALSPANALDVNLSSVRDIVEKISFFLDCIDTSIAAERDAF